MPAPSNVPLVQAIADLTATLHADLAALADQQEKLWMELRILRETYQKMLHATLGRERMEYSQGDQPNSEKTPR